MADMKKAGIQTFVKIVANKSNETLYRKFGIADSQNTLVICAPNGDALMVLGGCQCSQSGVSGALKNLDASLAAWKSRSSNKVETYSTK